MLVLELRTCGTVVSTAQTRRRSWRSLDSSAWDLGRHSGVDLAEGWRAGCAFREGRQERKARRVEGAEAGDRFRPINDKIRGPPPEF